jgi:hypothetical protein
MVLRTMLPMRQRLLLVAGWAAAAVITSLVSSGAVAVAGGQVLDQPSRPLSAAEVAALPVAVPAGASLNESEPLASGGSVPREAPPPSEQAATNGPGTGADGPAGDRGAFEIDVLDPSKPNLGRPIEGVDVALPPDPLDPSPETTSTVQHMRGGSVKVEVRGDSLIVRWVIPQPGYVTEVASTPGRLEIRFKGPVPGPTFVAWIEEGVLMTELVAAEAGVTQG